MKFKIDYHHWLILGASAAVGAIMAYLQSQQPGDIIQALGSWTTAKPLVFGALSAAVMAILALAKQSFVSTPPAPPASGSGSPPKTKFFPETLIHEKTPPPDNAAFSVLRKSGVFAVALFVIVLVACLPSQFPQDILAEYNCVRTQVEGGITNVGQIAIACRIQEEQIILDAINALLSSKSWVAEHPDLAVKMHATMKEHGR